MPEPATPPLAIGSDVWPGLAKLAEECGELIQVIGKLAAYPDGEHPDGAGDLRARLSDEMADVVAAIQFVASLNDVPLNGERVVAKTSRFVGWHHA